MAIRKPPPATSVNRRLREGVMSLAPFVTAAIGALVCAIAGADIAHAQAATPPAPNPWRNVTFGAPLTA
jgi:hypothetical protein